MNQRIQQILQWLRNRVTLQQTRAMVSKVCGDIFANWNGDIDPARLVGYGFVLLCGNVFLVLSIYDTLVHKSFNSLAFSTGCVAIAGQVLAAAVGVRLKQNSEIPMPNSPMQAQAAEEAAQAVQDAANGQTL